MQKPAPYYLRAQRNGWEIHRQGVIIANGATIYIGTDRVLEPGSNDPAQFKAEVNDVARTVTAAQSSAEGVVNGTFTSGIGSWTNATPTIISPIHLNQSGENFISFDSANADWTEGENGAVYQDIAVQSPSWEQHLLLRADMKCDGSKWDQIGMLVDVWANPGNVPVCSTGMKFMNLSGQWMRGFMARGDVPVGATSLRVMMKVHANQTMPMDSAFPGFDNISLVVGDAVRVTINPAATAGQKVEVSYTPGPTTPVKAMDGTLLPAMPMTQADNVTP